MDTGFGIAKLSYDLPSAINPSAKYIFFLHGKIVETYGPNGRHSSFGIYDYHGIVKSFENLGFKVISEVRPKGTKLNKYAGKILRQIKTLLAYGIRRWTLKVRRGVKGRGDRGIQGRKITGPSLFPGSFSPLLYWDHNIPLVALHSSVCSK